MFKGEKLSVTVPGIAGYGDLVEIGRGGYSRVYRARQYEFERPVAIKVLNESLKDSEAVEAFERECRTMGALWDHPNIVPVFASAFTLDDRPCIVMKLFHEGSYSQVLRNSGPIVLEELLAVGVKIAGALVAAHEAGVVHGDVKPHNIFKSRFGEPALGDFGIATFIGRQADNAPRGLSVHYAAPESVEVGPGPAADQYSLAATLFTMAVGRRPFESTDTTRSDSSTQVQVLLRVLEAPTPRLPDRFPREFGEVIWRAMARDPNQRYGDMSAFGDALASVQHGLGARHATGAITTAAPRVSAAREGLIEARLCRGCQRAHPPSATACLGCGAALNASTSVATAVPQPCLGTVRLSDGRVEALDADLVIGRNPVRESLETHQRAVVHGEADRTISRRHIELRLDGWNLSALMLGKHTRLERRGAIAAIDTSTVVDLTLGDTLLFGSDSWLRYDSDDHPVDTGDMAAPPHGAVYQQQDVTPQCDSEAHGPDGGTTVPSASPVEPCAASRVETVRLSGGSMEAVDADLVIGRNPARESLDPHQRAVSHGVGDRTISRRHLELRLNGGKLTVLCLGKRMRLEHDGVSREFLAGAEVRLELGDTIYYGVSSWLRYENVQNGPLSDPFK